MNGIAIKITVETIPSFEVADMMEKEHKEVMYMIEGNESRGVVGIIPALEISAELHVSDFFIKSTYKDSMNRTKDYYECTKMGCELLATRLNGSKGIIFATKYVKAFNDMEKAIGQVGQLVQQPQAQIGPRYSFSNYWIKRELSTIKPTDIPDYVDGLLEYIKSNKAADRLATYEITRAALLDLQPALEQAWQREMVQSSINRLSDLIELQRSYLNRADKGAKTKKINSLEQQLAELTQELEEIYQTEDNEDDYYLIPKSGFSANYMYSYGEKGKVVKSNAYRRWINNLHLELYLPRQYPNVDFTKPLRITAKFGQREGMDTNNFGKSLIDQIANYYSFDDSLVHDSRMLLYAFVDSYDDGYIFIKIENI